MEPSFVTLLLTCSILALIQLAAAVPWLAALDYRGFLALIRRPVTWVWGAAGVVAGGAALAFLLGANNERDTLGAFGRLYGAILQIQLSADFFVLVFGLLLLLWAKGGAVALAAFRESLRQPMFWMLFGLALFLMWVIPLLPYFTLGEDLKMVKELGYDVIMLFTVVFAIIAGSSSVSEEIEGRTAITLMSKPVSRRQFLLGKFAGFLMASLVMVSLLGWFLVWMFLFKQNLDPPIDPKDRVADPAWVLRFVNENVPAGEAAGFVRGLGLWFDDSVSVLPGLTIVSCQVMVLLAIATALATRIPMMVNVPICIAFYFLGHLTPVLLAVSRGRSRLVEFMAQVFDTILPGLEHFSLGATIVRDAPLPPADFALYTANVSLYAVMYTAIALLFGLILFEDRDLA